MLGVMTVGLHYRKIVEKNFNVAMPLIIGPPECGKSKCTELYSGLLGIKKKLQGIIYLKTFHLCPFIVDPWLSG